MVSLHPEILTKDGRKEFAVIPYEEFEAVQEMLGDLEDLKDFADAKAAEGDAETIPWDEVKRKLNL
jgi:PHD/YefM family antitoxin component YafN of YafNO toxin-antitoxin module